MIEREYTPQQALDSLMRKLSEQDKPLALRIQQAIDAGKDISEEEPASDRRRRARIYRRTIPFTHAEALQIALDALNAIFVEQPLFVDSAAEEMKMAAIGVPHHPKSTFAPEEDREELQMQSEGQEKGMEVELQTETRISRTDRETLAFKRTSREQIDRQRENVSRLRELISFEEK